MSDTIIIRCASCGEKIGEIAYVPGRQRVGCQECGGVTIIDIYDDGKIETKERLFWGD